MMPEDGCTLPMDVESMPHAAQQAPRSQLLLSSSLSSLCAVVCSSEPASLPSV